MTYSDSRNNTAQCLLKQRGFKSGITPGEKIFLLTHFLDLGKISDDKEKALSEAALRYDPNTLHNGRGDAFRHCYLSALLTRDVGAESALELTSLHEDWCGNPEAERVMDLHNNAIGIAIGKMVSTDFRDQALADLCQKAEAEGKLKTLF
jgi:hypothetical protein